MAVLVTRPHPDDETTAKALRARGFDVLRAPMLRFEPVPFQDDADANYGAVIVTSAACSRSAPTRSTIVTPLLGTGQVSTSRHDLARTIATTREKVAKAPDDVPAAVMLADALDALTAELKRVGR